MAPLHFSRGMVHAWLRSHVDLNELGWKAFASKIFHGLLPAFPITSSHYHEDSFRGELPGDFPIPLFAPVTNAIVSAINLAFLFPVAIT
jgi:hypothetical protein